MAYLVSLFVALLLAAAICPPATTMFINNFIAAEKEEIYVSELEDKLECVSDDDKEVPDWMVSYLTAPLTLANSRTVGRTCR